MIGCGQVSIPQIQQTQQSLDTIPNGNNPSQWTFKQPVSCPQSSKNPSMLSLILSSDPQSLPIVHLCVADRVYPFMVDTWTTCTSFGKQYCGPMLSTSINFVRIDGVTVTSPDDHDIMFYHKFVVIPSSPFNLLGCNLFSKLCCSLSFKQGHFVLCTPSNYLFSSIVSPKPETQDNLVIPVALVDIPHTLWVTHANEVGHI